MAYPSDLTRWESWPTNVVHGQKRDAFDDELVEYGQAPQPLPERAILRPPPLVRQHHDLRLCFVRHDLNILVQALRTVVPRDVTQVLLVIGLEEHPNSIRIRMVQPSRELQIPQIVVLDLEAVALGPRQAPDQSVVVREVVGVQLSHGPAHRPDDSGQAQAARKEGRAPADACDTRSVLGQRLESHPG